MGYSLAYYISSSQNILSRKRKMRFFSLFLTFSCLIKISHSETAVVVYESFTQPHQQKPIPGQEMTSSCSGWKKRKNLTDGLSIELRIIWVCFFSFSSKLLPTI